ncbi:MAG: hypothetical protein ACR2P5_06930 [Gammaproteobacteria bacterium]
MSFPRRRESSPFREAENFAAIANGAACAAGPDSCFRRNDMSLEWHEFDLAHAAELAHAVDYAGAVNLSRISA